MFIKVASSPRLSGIGIPSPIFWSHSLKMQRIVLLSSLLWWELGTNSLITGPGEWLSFRCFTRKLSWSWDVAEQNDKVHQTPLKFEMDSSTKWQGWTNPFGKYGLRYQVAIVMSSVSWILTPVAYFSPPPWFPTGTVIVVSGYEYFIIRCRYWWCVFVVPTPL